MPEYLKRIKSGDLVDQFHVVLKEIKKGKFDKSFELLDSYGIGPQTLSPKKRNFLYILIEPINSLIDDEEFSDITVSEGLKICEFFKLFFARGVDVNHQDKRGLTLLQWTSILGCDNLVQFLLEQGADPNLIDDCSRTALDCVVESQFADPIPNPLKQGGCLAIIPLLLRAGANPFRPYPCFDEIKSNKKFEWNLGRDGNKAQWKNAFDCVTWYAEQCKKDPTYEVEPICQVFMQTLKELGKLPKES